MVCAALACCTSLPWRTTLSDARKLGYSVREHSLLLRAVCLTSNAMLSSLCVVLQAVAQACPNLSALSIVGMRGLGDRGLRAFAERCGRLTRLAVGGA